MKRITRYSLDNILASNVVGRKIAMYRNQRKMTQEELSKAITNVLSMPKNFMSTNISLYESGRRMPPIHILIALSIIFGVSLDDLVGCERKENVLQDKNGEKDTPLLEYDVVVPPQKYKVYDGQPVYVVSVTNNVESQWGILDAGLHRIVTKSMIIPLSAAVKVHRFKPRDATFIDIPSQTALGIKGLLQAKIFWVERIDGDRAMRAMYRGWYRHNEARTCIINTATGLTLPYEGLGISYNAFDVEMG